MPVADTWTERKLFGDNNIQEEVQSWLLHDVERVCNYPQWLEKSVGMSKVYPERASPSELSLVAEDNKALMVCDHEDDSFCLGTVVRGCGIAMPVNLGDAVQARFAFAINPRDGTFSRFISTLYKSGRIALTEYCGSSTSRLAKTIIFHRNHPDKTLGAVNVAEEVFPDVWEAESQGEHPRSFYHFLNPQPAHSGMRLWSAFVAMYPSEMQGWKSLKITTTVEGLGLPPAKHTHSVAALVQLFCDGNDIQELRQSYVQDLFAKAVGKPLQGVESGGDRLSIESLSENSGLLEPPSAPSSSTVEKRGEEHPCSDCGARFRRKYELNRHFQSVHIGVRKHACDICLKSFTQASHVRVHIETVHNKSKTCTCELCGQGFGTKHKLVRHQRSVHERLRPHACSICEAAYYQSSDLKRHMRKKHEVVSI